MPFEDIPRPGLWKRLLLGAFLVVFAAAAATSVAAFHEVDKVVTALKINPELKLGQTLAETDPGEPQTLMILGSDKRPRDNAEGAGSGARSDTIMLVRMNPDKDAIAVMSLPRDLKVQIPGYGVEKINAAYELGGPELTLKTVKALTGLPINHVINVDFAGFGRAVNALGCVYADIDRRYYNDTAEYAYIDVPAGYQRMCGDKALQYVRFRHEDTDLVRSARQQDFLRQTKQQVATGDLIGQRDRLLRIFGKTTSTDAALRSSAEILRLVKLAVGTAGQPIREVHFEGTIGPSYVEATDAQVQKLVQQFLGVEESSGPRGEAKRRPGHKRKQGPVEGLTKDTQFGKDQALQAVQAGAGKRLPVYFPTVRTSESEYRDVPRVYRVRDEDGRVHQAYRMVLTRGQLLGENYGLQGITWKDAPILREPQETRTIGKRTYELHYDGDRLRLVAWKTPKAAYWISNTLLLSLTNRQMMAIARSARTL
jgi:polyisoprenyl-teichoic acid--peptidoglycan teichoic acid transferase